MLEESVCELVVTRLKQLQNRMEDKFIVCLNRATKNFPSLADRCVVLGGQHCPLPPLTGGDCVVSTALGSLALPAGQVHEHRPLPAAEVPRGDEDALSGGGAVSCGADH